MTETKTKIHEVFVDISLLLLASWSLLTVKMRMLLSQQQCMLHTVWLCRTQYLVISSAVTKTKRWLKLQLKFSKFSST